MRLPVPIKVKRLHPDAVMPTKATKGSGCYDVYSVGEYRVGTLGVTNVRTGLSFEVPRGYMLEIRPRSGLSLRDLVIVNSPGTLDSDYRGELIILMKYRLQPGEPDNRSDFYTIQKGDRVAQIRVIEETPVTFVESKELSETARGAGGFGSTGR